MIQYKEHWVSISALATITAITIASQGCNVFAGLDDVKFEGSGGAGAAGGGGAGDGGNPVTGPTTGSAGGMAGGGGISMGGQGGMNNGGSMQTSSVGGGMATSSSAGGTMTTSSSAGGTMTTGSSGGGGPGNTVGCGAMKTCALGTEVCCWDERGTQNKPETGQCIAIAEVPALCDDDPTPTGMQSIIECQTSDQCMNGKTCCGFVNTVLEPFYQSIKCQIDCPGGGPTIIMCSGPGDPICPAPSTCGESMLLPAGYFRCMN